MLEIKEELFRGLLETVVDPGIPVTVENGDMMRAILASGAVVVKSEQIGKSWFTEVELGENRIFCHTSEAQFTAVAVGASLAPEPSRAELADQLAEARGIIALRDNVISNDSEMIFAKLTQITNLQKMAEAIYAIAVGLAGRRWWWPWSGRRSGQKILDLIGLEPKKK